MNATNCETNPKFDSHMNIEEIRKKTAIVILAHSDYESLELALATHSKFLPDTIPEDGNNSHPSKIFILQNGRGTYDTERTLQVALRYQTLFPHNIEVVTDIPPGIAYFSIEKLLYSQKFANYEYIVKLDDDVLVLTENWLDELISCYISSYKRYGDKLAYVTSLVNNNPY